MKPQKRWFGVTFDRCPNLSSVMKKQRVWQISLVMSCISEHSP